MDTDIEPPFTCFGDCSVDWRNFDDSLGNIAGLESSYSINAYGW